MGTPLLYRVRVLAGEAYSTANKIYGGRCRLYSGSIPGPRATADTPLFIRDARRSNGPTPPDYAPTTFIPFSARVRI